MDWKQEAEALKFTQGKSWTETAKIIGKKYFPGLDAQQAYEKVRRALRCSDSYKKGKVTYEDKKEPTQADVAEYYEMLKKVNAAAMKLESKKADTYINLN